MAGTALPVPESLQGVWRRTLLTTPEGVEDRTTEVRWLQCGSLFLDLRIPAAAQSAGAPPEALAASVSFAGRVTFEGGRCSWHREVDFGTPFLPAFDFSPPPGTDTAALKWTGPERT